MNGKVLSTFGNEGSDEGQFKFPRYEFLIVFSRNTLRCLEYMFVIWICQIEQSVCISTLYKE